MSTFAFDRNDVMTKAARIVRGARTFQETVDKIVSLGREQFEFGKIAAAAPQPHRDVEPQRPHRMID